MLYQVILLNAYNGLYVLIFIFFLSGKNAVAKEESILAPVHLDLGCVAHLHLAVEILALKTAPILNLPPQLPPVPAVPRFAN